MQKIIDVLNVRAVGNDIFEGPVVASQISRTFGGQVISQALRAAQATVADCFEPRSKSAHSLHSYFVAPADSTKPLRLEVERLRDGRSFAQRQVRISQEGELKNILLVSFHVDSDEGPQHSASLPSVVPAESLLPAASQPETKRVILGDWDEWDIRMIPENRPNFSPELPRWPGYRNLCFRNVSSSLPDPATHQDFHVAALAYMSDMTLIRSALVEHPNAKVQMASLDHAIWFHRRLDVGEWMLYSQDSPAAGSGRGFTRGTLFNMEGHVIASVVQEGLLRALKS